MIIIKKLNNKGVALIAAVVTTVIFLMLVITVTVISVATYKKSGQSHDRAMALNLAEAGINDTLYQMNYKYYDVLPANGADYPAVGEYLNPTFSPGPTNTMWQTSPSLNDPFGVGSGNGYIVQALTTGAANADELRSTGIYNGKRRVISINIRGRNIHGDGLSNPTNGSNGIAEAFNKHAIYATTVAVAGATVNGNIAYNALPAPGSAGPVCTTTFIDPVNPTLFGVPDSTVLTNLPASTRIYTDGSRPGPVSFPADFGPGSMYNPLTGTYTFPAGVLSDYNFEFANMSDPFPILNLSLLTGINSSIKTSGALTLNTSKTIGGGVVFQPALGITVSPGVTITGDLIVAGRAITLNGTVPLPIHIDGNVLCDNDITLGNVPGGTVIVNGLLYTSSASLTPVTIGNVTTNDVTITGAVVAKGTGTVTLNLCMITWDKVPFIATNVGNVYDNFIFGRRVYLPVPGTWREE